MEESERTDADGTERELLAKRCEEQRLRIELLEQQLKERDKELLILRKHSSPAKPAINSFFDPFPSTKPHFPPPRASGSEFWDNHLDNSEGNDYSFEDIAAKGLWIMSSGTERKTVVSTNPIKAISSQRTMPLASPKRPTILSPTRERMEQHDTVQLPQLRDARKPNASASPLQPRILPQRVDRDMQRPSYLRMSFKRSEKRVEVSPGRAVLARTVRKASGSSPSVRIEKPEQPPIAKGQSASPTRTRKSPEGHYSKAKRPQVTPLKAFQPVPGPGYSNLPRRAKR